MLCPHQTTRADARHSRTAHVKPVSTDYFVAQVGADGTARTLDLERNPTVLLVWAANRFNRNASRYYQTHFGITAMDWRMLVMLCSEPGISVSAASPVSGYDKGAVSRSLQNLEQLQLAEGRAEGRNNRHKQWYLTRKGQRLHDRILAAALERQQLLLSGMQADEVMQFNSLLKRFLHNLEQLEQ